LKKWNPTDNKKRGFNLTTNKILTMSIEEVAAELQVSVKTLQNRKSANDDFPPAIKYGKKLIFLRKEFMEWLENLPRVA